MLLDIHVHPKQTMSSEQEWVVVVQADRQHQHQHQHQQQHQHQVPSDDASLVTAHTSEFTYDFAAEEDDLASSDSVESASALTTAVTRVTSAAAAATATGAVAGAAATGAATQRRKVLPTEALLLHQGVQDRREFFGRWLTQLSVIPHGASGPVVHNIDSFMAVAGALVRTSNGGGDDISDHSHSDRAALKTAPTSRRSSVVMHRDASATTLAHPEAESTTTTTTATSRTMSLLETLFVTLVRSAIAISATPPVVMSSGTWPWDANTSARRFYDGDAYNDDTDSMFDYDDAATVKWQHATVALLMA